MNPIVTRRITMIATGLLIENRRSAESINMEIEDTGFCVSKKRSGGILFKEAALLFVLLFWFAVG